MKSRMTWSVRQGMKTLDIARHSCGGSVLVLVLASSFVGFEAGAQLQPAGSEPPLLSGPEIRTGDGGLDTQAAGASMEGSVRASPTLIERSFDGTLIELDVNPAEAALGLLDLTDEEVAATRRVLEARAELVWVIARDHLELFLKLQTARQGGDQDALRPLMREAMPILAQLLRPTMAESLAAELSEANAQSLQRMVDEYRRAVMENRTSGSEHASSGRLSQTRAELRYESGLVLREIARSIAATVEARRDQAESLYEAVGATPEQREQIQAILRQMGATVGLESPSPGRRREVMEKILQVLRPEQRERARAYLRAG